MEKIRVFVDNVFSGLPKTKEVIDMKRDILSNMEEHYLELIKQGKDEDTAFGIVVSEFGSIEDIRRELNLDEILYNESNLPIDEDNPMISYFQRKFRNGIIAGVVCCIIGVFGTAVIYEIFYYNYLVEAMQIAWFSVFVCIGVILFIYWGMEKDRFEKSCGSLNGMEAFQEAPMKNKKMKGIINGILWQLTVLIYLLMGFFMGLWHPGWIIFIISAIISSVINAFL